jgi:hypothetical protein
MTISATSIDQCRVMRAHWEQVNRNAFDRMPVGAVFQVIRRRSSILEGVYVKVGADTVSDCGTLKGPGEALCFLADNQIRVVSEPEDGERFDGQS